MSTQPDGTVYVIAQINIFIDLCVANIGAFYISLTLAYVIAFHHQEHMCLFMHTVPGIIINSQRAQLFMENCKCIFAIYSYKYRERYSHVRYLYIIWINNRKPVTGDTKLTLKSPFLRRLNSNKTTCTPQQRNIIILIRLFRLKPPRVFQYILAIIRHIAVAAITLCHMLHRKIAAIHWFIAFIWTFGHLENKIMTKKHVLFKKTEWKPLLSEWDNNAIT